MLFSVITVVNHIERENYIAKITDLAILTTEEQSGVFATMKLMLGRVKGVFLTHPDPPWPGGDASLGEVESARSRGEWRSPSRRNRSAMSRTIPGNASEEGTSNYIHLRGGAGLRPHLKMPDTYPYPTDSRELLGVSLPQAFLKRQVREDNRPARKHHQRRPRRQHRCHCAGCHKEPGPPSFSMTVYSAPAPGASLAQTAFFVDTGDLEAKVAWIKEGAGAPTSVADSTQRSIPAGIMDAREWDAYHNENYHTTVNRKDPLLLNPRGVDPKCREMLGIGANMPGTSGIFPSLPRPQRSVADGRLQQAAGALPSRSKILQPSVHSSDDISQIRDEASAPSQPPALGIRCDMHSILLQDMLKLAAQERALAQAMTWTQPDSQIGLIEGQRRVFQQRVDQWLREADRLGLLVRGWTIQNIIILVQNLNYDPRVPAQPLLSALQSMREFQDIITLHDTVVAKSLRQVMQLGFQNCVSLNTSGDSGEFIDDSDVKSDRTVDLSTGELEELRRRYSGLDTGQAKASHPQYEKVSGSFRLANEGEHIYASSASSSSSSSENDEDEDEDDLSEDVADCEEEDIAEIMRRLAGRAEREAIDDAINVDLRQL